LKKDLTTGDISLQIKSVAIPSSIGFFFYTMFNITDTYFASLISTNAIASLVLASTVYFMIISISRGMSTAVTSLLGNTLGEKNTIKVQNLSMHAYVFAIFMVLFLYVFFFAFVDFIFNFTASSNEYLANSIVFINIIVLGLPFFLFASYSNAILISHGDTKSFRNILISNFILNIILNYWFIYGGLGLDAMGFSGIAYATITTEFITMCYLFNKVFKLNIIKINTFKFDINIIKEILFQGLPSTLNMTLMSMGSFILIYYISILGDDIVAAYGIGIRLEQMALIPSIGLSIAVSAMISQNNGARNYVRIENIMNKIYKYAYILYITGGVFMVLCMYVLAPLFTQSVLVLNEAQIYLKINAILLLAYILIFVNVSFLQAIKRPNMIFYIGLFRQIIMPTILFYIAYYYNLSAVYYWIATFISVSIATFYIHYLHKNYLRELIEEN